MKKKNVVNEIFFIRAFACLAVVLLHAIGASMNVFGIPQNEHSVINNSRLLLLFATPLFIIISEFLLSYSYSEKLPKTFFPKRIKYILVPFIFMALLYSIVTNYPNLNFESVLDIFLHNLQGNYHGYFILIIFQFYILHALFIKVENKVSPIVILIVTFIINVGYLSYFNLTSPPNTLTNGDVIWKRWYWYPFLAWIFYFAIAYYCGKHFERFKELVNKHIGKIVVLSLFSCAAILYLYYVEIIPVMSSKRVDVFLFTIMIWFILFYIASKMNRLPTIVNWISRLSFGIYLLHPFFQIVLIENVSKTAFPNFYVYLVFLFTGSMILSGVTTYLLSLTHIGKYLIGSVGNIYKKRQKRKYSNQDNKEQVLSR
ncbi:acyltransferase family protein [Metabacillus arenae]|uniref:Acyltransferase family protein n=1 Tax=Metabacillus arenae TaxID=2771434 RepID=A0A926RX18_9BACI|nr:acyltransferase family protein [Metabacillus arenae]MBD1381378.1 acyltransferase family protein [Metabacillus arenae]